MNYHLTMQSERDEESYGKKSSNNDDDKDRPAKEQTIEYHLKAAHSLYCDEVRALRIRVKALNKKLKDEASREFICSQCESINKSSEKQAIAFEEKLREKNKIICELRHKLELNELQTSSTSFGSANHRIKKRRIYSRNDCINPKQNEQQNLSSDDEVTILAMKSDPTNLSDHHIEWSTEGMEIEPEKPSTKSCSNRTNFVYVPETLVEDMGIKPSITSKQINKVVCVPETLHTMCDFGDRESPVFNNFPSNAIIRHVMINEKGDSQCSLVKTSENSKRNDRLNSKRSVNVINEVEQQRKAREAGTGYVPTNTSFHELVNEDLDMSMDEFKSEPTRKGKLSKAVNKCENQVNKPANGNSFESKITATRRARTPSPHYKYKLNFSPARPGHRKPKYKQTTLTQKAFKEQKDGELDLSTADNELKRAIEESLRDHEASPSLDASRKQKKTISTEQSDDDENGNSHDQNDSCLDATFVSSQILTKKRSRKCDTATSKTRRSIKSKESKMEYTADDTPDSEDLIQQMINQPSPQKDKTSKNSVSRQGITSEPIRSHDDDNCLDDFDIIPNYPGLNFKYKENAVRKQNERRKLDGYECRDCAAYVAAMGLSDEEKKKRLNECSRHRGKYALPATPEHFWSIDFPSTQECKERGVMNTTQYKPLQRRRRLRK